jgi:hypothetical protein
MTLEFLRRWSPVLAPEGAGGGGSSGASASPPASTSPSSSQGSGPSSPTPSGTPSTPATAAPAPSGDAPADGGDGMDFASFLDGTAVGGEAPDTGTPTDLGVQRVEAAPGTPPVPPAATPATEARPVASPQETTSPAQLTPSGVGAALDPADPVAIMHALVANEAAATAHIANTLFRLSPEEVEALETNAVAAVPQLLAKGFVKSQVNLLQQLGQIVPKMMQRHIEAVRANSTNENKFYGRWPGLKSHGDLVKRLAVTYRQMNPSAPLNQMIEELGPIVMLAATLPMQQLPGVPPGNGAVRAPQPTPFVPAMGGPGSSPNSENTPNEWEAIFSHE